MPPCRYHTNGQSEEWVNLADKAYSWEKVEINSKAVEEGGTQKKARQTPSVHSVRFSSKVTKSSSASALKSKATPSPDMEMMGTVIEVCRVTVHRTQCRF